MAPESPDRRIRRLSASRPTRRTSRTRAAARPRDRRRGAAARSGRAASALRRPAAGAAAAAPGAGPPATAASSVGSTSASVDADRRRFVRSCAAGASRRSRASAGAATGRRRSRARPHTRARRRARTRRRRRTCTRGRARTARGTSGSLQSSVIRCSRCTDCARPSTASSSGALPRAKRAIAAQMRGGTGRRGDRRPSSRPRARRAFPARPSSRADVAVAREHAPALGDRRALVAHDGGREEPRPRAAPMRSLIAASLTPPPPSSPARARPRRGSRRGRARRASPPSRRAITFSASSRFDSSSWSIRSSSVPMQMRLCTNTGLRWPNAVHAVGRLLLDRRVPPAVEVE